MTTNETMLGISLSDPIFTIEHIALLFHVRVDTAREYVARADFPPSRQLGARLLFDRGEVLTWFRDKLPRLTAADRRRSAVPQNTAALTSATAPAASTYRRRRNARNAPSSATTGVAA